MSKPLFNTAEWTVPLIDKTWREIDKLGKEWLGLDYYEPQIEIISAEAMLDAYSSHGLPINYSHWAFGKDFVKNERAYKRGQTSLAYELVINTDPCIVYLMQDNTMTMQALTLAHAGVGHNAFFKNNYCFTEWTSAHGIVDYMKFAKGYIADCEVKYGQTAVSRLLDACHALQHNGVDKYKHPRRQKADARRERQKVWEDYTAQQHTDVNSTIPGFTRDLNDNLSYQLERLEQANATILPEENILYFIEKYSPTLATWEKEVVRIVRKIAQYFYPQMKTKLMNEGFASFTHYQIMTEMWERGLITEGSYLEFLQSHTAVCKHHHYSQPARMNVYALGYHMFSDIKRICTKPTAEDAEWFPDIVNKPWQEVIQDIVVNYKDDSFILQWLSPKAIRDMRLFNVHDDAKSDYTVITDVSSHDSIRKLRKALSEQHSLEKMLPQIEVSAVNWKTDRMLYLTHRSNAGVQLDEVQTKKTLAYIKFLWGYDVHISEISGD